MEEVDGRPPRSSKAVAPALIALPASGRCVVVAIGAALRVFDLVDNVAVSCQDDSVPALHWDAIRAISFSRDGKLFASAGDDKLVKLWDASSWHCLKTVRLNKKVSAVAFSHDCSWLMFADKFGVVYVTSTAAQTAIAAQDAPRQLLAHCCSIITGLESSPDGKFVATSDRDFKIRVSLFPRDPPAGAHQINSYCLGHTSFVSCIAFVGGQGSQCLVSGGGDGTVRLWQYTTGKLLDVYQTNQEAGTDRHGVENEEQDVTQAIHAISVSHEGSVVAASGERLEGIILLRCDTALGKLSYMKTVVPTEQICPTSLAFDPEGRLWLVAGAAATVETGDEFVTPEAAAIAEAKGKAIAAAATCCVDVVDTASLANDDAGSGEGEKESSIAVPGGQTLLDCLQGNRIVGAVETAQAAEAAELAMKNLLSKRQYTVQQREHRKRLRNDKRLSSKS